MSTTPAAACPLLRCLAVLSEELWRENLALVAHVLRLAFALAGKRRSCLNRFQTASIRIPEAES